MRIANIVKINRRLVQLIALSALVVSAGSSTACHVSGGFFSISASELTQSHAKNAEEALQAGELDQAISEYRLHLDERLDDPNRPNWENPYFYSVLIGDIYLKQDLPERAKDSYLLAKENRVSNDVIVDRIRSLSRYYAAKGNLEEALSLLKEFRNLEPLMIDFDIDQLHRKIIEKEDAAKQSH